MTESKQYRIIYTDGIGNGMAQSLKKSLIELLSPKQNGSIEMDRNAPNKATNKATIKSMWKKAFKSLKTKEPSISEKSDGGEQSSGAHRKSSRQSSFRKSLLRRKDSKERESDQETNDDPVPEEGRVVDPVFQHLKYARFIGTRSESQDSGHSSDQSGVGPSSSRPLKY